jgi:hypothetical protein
MEGAPEKKIDNKVEAEFEAAEEAIRREVHERTGEEFEKLVEDAYQERERLRKEKDEDLSNLEDYREAKFRSETLNKIYIERAKSKGV